MGLQCKRCGGEEHVKNGLMRGKQRYRYKACGLNFTDTPPRGMPLAMKVTAVLLYVSGRSMNRTAKLLGVSTPSVMAWMATAATGTALAQVGGRQGHRLHDQALGSTDPVHDRRPDLSHQQRGRTSSARGGRRPAQLDLCRLRSWWRAGGR